jgi:D-3-phosphoglycerate dehydrogenase / 2-oxoglutarate reductase
LSQGRAGVAEAQSVDGRQGPEPAQTVVIVDRGFAATPDAVEVLEKAGLKVVVSSATEEEDVLRAVCNADGIIDNGHYSRRLLEALTRCKVIARSGIGMDVIDDVDIATKKGIVLCNMPGIIEEEVADHTMALLLAVARRVVALDRYVREGGWDKDGALPDGYMPRLTGSRLGLVGLGRIGRAFVRRAAGFGFEIIAHDPFVPSQVFAECGVRQVTLGEVLQDSDIVSLHVPLTAETRHLLGEHELKLMRRNSILVNTCRGPVVDEQALIEALEVGQIAGAGLDVMEQEPIGADHPLCRLQNVVLSPHCASRSIWADEERHIRPAQEVAAVLAGLRPRAVWNPEVLDRLALR